MRGAVTLSCAGLTSLRRAGLVSIPPVLIFILLLQLLVGFHGLGSPFSSSSRGVGGDVVVGGWWEMEEEPAFSFSVISIEPEKRSGPPRRGGAASSSVGPDLLDNDDDDDEDGDGGVGRRRGGQEENLVLRYEDENEMPTRQGQGQLELQSWAAGEPSFTAELDRLMAYMTTPQVNCSRVLVPGQSQASPQASGGPAEAWLLCAEDWLLPAAHSPCVAYSFSMDGGDADFLKTALGLGCEVHRFDPGRSSRSDASTGHGGGQSSPAAAAAGGKSLARGEVRHHKMWLEWRAAPRRRKRRQSRRGGGGGGTLGSVSRTLADIMEALGHHTVDFLYADLLSAEWRVFQNWLELETLWSVHHLVATAHLQWAGFEVGGADEEVLRYWFSVLQGLRACGFRLVHSAPRGEGRSVLKRTVENAHSSYTLSWVNMRH